VAGLWRRSWSLEAFESESDLVAEAA